MAAYAHDVLPFHRFADLFPLIDGAEFDGLVEDIRQNAVREPVMLLDGQILDGRNRYRALLRLVETKALRGKGWGDFEGQPFEAVDLHPADRTIFHTFVETPRQSALDYVISKNLHRRHLTESQRSIAAAEIATMRQGERTDITEPSANLQKVDQATAAKMLNVSPRSVASAKVVKDKGTPELQKAVKQGKVAVSAAEAVASLPAAEQNEVVARGEKEIVARAKEINAKKRDIRRAERFENIRQISANNQPLPADRKYPVIYADPPWRFESGFSDRSIENHYPTMTVDEICALGVADLATKDAVLFMWVTIPHAMNAAKVLDAWGFKYASQHAWDKETQITGHWFYGRHEILIVATRGSFPAPAPEAKAQSLYREKRSPKHSEKPKYYYEMIERMTPDLPRIELFSRGGRPGWTAWGNQAQAAHSTADERGELDRSDSHHQDQVSRDALHPAEDADGAGEADKAPCLAPSVPQRLSTNGGDNPPLSPELQAILDRSKDLEIPDFLKRNKEPVVKP